MIPMYLAYKPPQMLPTQTMNPTSAATASGAPAGPTGKVKRTAEGDEILPFNRHVLKKRGKGGALIDAERWWWIGVGMTALGGVGYLCF